jgi:hypothetical protein
MEQRSDRRAVDGDTDERIAGVGSRDADRLERQAVLAPDRGREADREDDRLALGRGRCAGSNCSSGDGES